MALSLRHVEDAKNLACAFFGYGQCHIERLGSHRSLAVYLDVHAVNEHDWVIFFETAFKPFIDLRCEHIPTIRLMLDLE